MIAWTLAALPGPLTTVIRDGARKLTEQAIEAELAALMTAIAEDKLEDGRARLVRHGPLPEREGLTGVGPVPVKVPRARIEALAAGEWIETGANLTAIHCPAGA